MLSQRTKLARSSSSVCFLSHFSTFLTLLGTLSWHLGHPWWLSLHTRCIFLPISVCTRLPFYLLAVPNDEREECLLESDAKLSSSLEIILVNLGLYLFPLLVSSSTQFCVREKCFSDAKLSSLLEIMSFPRPDISPQIFVGPPACSLPCYLPQFVSSGARIVYNGLHYSSFSAFSIVPESETHILH